MSKRNGKQSSRSKGKFPRDYPQREESKEKFDRWEEKEGKGRDCFRSKANDPMWYAQNPALLRDAASFPYGWPVGNRLDLEAGSTLAGGSIPGVMAFYINPGVGQSLDENSPVNMAAKNLYAFVRHMNSGHTNYDSPDLMMYMLAMDSVYSYHAFLKRIYGLAQAYTPTNRYYPKAIITAMGVDYDDVMAHLAQLRYGINALQAKFDSMRIPNSMSYMARHMWMYTGIYQDGETDKCQTYLYTPHAFYTYGYDDDGAGMLKYTEFMRGFTAEQLYSVQELIEFGNSLINPILASEDMGIMSGDIMKAFGAQGMVSLQPVSDTYIVLPEYNREVLSQMENLTMIGYPTVASANITQEGVDPTTQLPHAWITFDPQFAMHRPFETLATHGWRYNPNEDPTGVEYSTLWIPNTMKRIINFHWDDVQPANTIVATRLTNILTPQDRPTTVTDLTSITATCSTMGSEYVCSACMFYYAGNGPQWTLRSSPYLFTNMLYVELTGLTANNQSSDRTPDQVQAIVAAINDLFADYGQSVASYQLALLRISEFDWHPMFVPVRWNVSARITATGTVTPENGSNYIDPPVGFSMDVENYTTMTKHDLERLSESALLSEFQVPQMGAFAKRV